MKAYSLIEDHKEKSIVKQWPIRMDFVLYSVEKQQSETTKKLKAEAPSIYFDTMDKCKKWVKAINWILDPSPVGYRASMRKPGQVSTVKKTVTIIEEHKEIAIKEEKQDLFNHLEQPAELDDNSRFDPQMKMPSRWTERERA